MGNSQDAPAEANWWIAGCGYTGMALAMAEVAAGRPVYTLSRGEVAESWDHACHDLSEEPWVGRPGQPISVRHALFLVSPGVRSGGSIEDYRRALRNWVASCRELGISRLVMASSIGVYCQTDGSLVNEDSAVGGTARADQLRESEEVFLRDAAEAGASALVLRIGGIYGPDRHRFFSGFTVGDNQWLNLIHRDDLVEGLQALAGRWPVVEGEGMVLNLTDGNPATRGEIRAWLDATYPDLVQEGSEGGSSRRGSAHRRVDSSRFRELVGWEPKYGDFRAGCRAV